MNVVSVYDVIVNIQGIRYVTWGETASHYVSSRDRFYVKVVYKGNQESFGFKTQSEALDLFTKLREAMDKSIAKDNTLHNSQS